MAHKSIFKFNTITLKFGEVGMLTTSLLEPEVIRVDSMPYVLTGQFAQAFQDEVIDKGNYKEILNYTLENEQFETGEFAVPFAATKKSPYPDFELKFNYLYQHKADGIWALIPALGIEAFSEKEEKLEANLIQSVKAEFARKKRLRQVHDIISTIWFDGMELSSHDIHIQFRTPSELEALSEEKRVELLPKAAKKMLNNRQILYGRKSELLQISRKLKGQFNKNLLLVGPSGVGKSALIWEIVRDRAIYKLKQEIWETTASTMIKELTMDTGWEDNLAHLCKELGKRGDFLFIRNLLELFEVGQYEGNSLSMGGYLREYLGRGEINVISECTDEEFARIEQSNPNFTQLFQVIRLEEPTDDLEEIITHRVLDISHKEGVSIELEAIDETVRLNRRYTPYSGFPGKPIRFLESILINQKIGKKAGVTKKLNRSKVIEYFCEETGMPPFMVDPSIPMDIKNIENFFQSNVYGQSAAVNSVLDILASVKTALTPQGKPIASLLFVGPTGVGKTEMAKVIADFMFGSRERMIRFDMSEYSNPYSVTRLTGESYFSDGLLTSAVRREPFSVVLFDEIEKAHPLFYDLLLQLLGEGRLTDSSGKLVNFCSTIIIMTSNIGAANLQNDKIGWKSTLDTTEVTDHFMSAVRKHFRPELYNRIDKVIPFEPLTQAVVQNVVQREIELFKKREGILHRKVDLNLADELLEYLAIKGYDPKYGARQLQRVIREELIIPLSQRLNLQNFDDHLIVSINIKDNQPDIQIEMDPLKIDLLLEELERNNWADHASELRRSIQQLQEGRSFVKLLSNLDLLERKKKKLKEKFWAKKADCENYSNLLDTREQAMKMTAIIEEYEMEFVLICMNMRVYKTNIIDKIEAWKKDYLALKIEIFNRLNPQSNSCQLTIFGGAQLTKMVDLYSDIFSRKKYEVEANTLWYRESYFNELVEKKEGEPPTPRKMYVKNPFHHKEEDCFAPPEEGDRLIGVEYQIQGSCAFLYLEEEAGLHQWKVTDKKINRKFVVQVAPKKSLTPDNAHLPTFYANRIARRHLEDGALMDNEYSINREIQKKKFAAFIVDCLDKRFGAKLDKVLF